jgi:hypothetical protein
MSSAGTPSGLGRSNSSTPKGSQPNLSYGKLSNASSASNISPINTSSADALSSPTTAQIRQAFKNMVASPVIPTGSGGSGSLKGSGHNLNMAVDGSRRRSSAQSYDSQSPISSAGKVCDKCRKTVYPVEAVTVEGKLIHKSVSFDILLLLLTYSIVSQM